MMRDKKLILLIGLSVVAIISLVYGIVTPSKMRRNLESKAGTVQAASAGQISETGGTVRQLRRSDFALWGRNPFLSRETPAHAGTRLVLNGIAWDEKNPRAVINDRILSVGGEVAGNKVVKIEPHRVLLSDGVNDMELRLGKRIE